MHLYGMPYKDPGRKAIGSKNIARSVSQRRRAQRATLSPTLSSKVVRPTGPIPEEEEHSGWGVFLLFAGIVLSLPILYFGFGSGQTTSIIPLQITKIVMARKTNRFLSYHTLADYMCERACVCSWN